MRAILILGVMLMAWPDDMRAVSAAIAAQFPYRRSRDEIPSATEPTKEEMWQRAPERADIWEFERRVKSGELTHEEANRLYRQKWGIPEPPPPLPDLPQQRYQRPKREWD